MRECGKGSYGKGASLGGRYGSKQLSAGAGAITATAILATGIRWRWFLFLLFHQTKQQLITSSCFILDSFRFAVHSFIIVFDFFLFIVAPSKSNVNEVPGPVIYSLTNHEPKFQIFSAGLPCSLSVYSCCCCCAFVGFQCCHTMIRFAKYKALT